MESHLALLLLAGCWVVSVHSQTSTIDCNDYRKFGGPCLQRACCRNLEMIVTRNCAPRQQPTQTGTNAAMPAYNTYSAQGQPGPLTYNTYSAQGQPGPQTYNTYSAQGQPGPQTYNTYSAQGQLGSQTSGAQPGVQSYNTVAMQQPIDPQRPQSIDNTKEARCRSGEDFRRKNLLRADGRIDVAKVVVYLGREVTLKDRHWTVEIIDRACKKCYARAEEIVKLAGYTECTTGAYEMERCIELDLFEFCPASNWNDSQPCNDARNYVRSCPIKPEVEQHEENGYHPHSGLGGL